MYAMYPDWGPAHHRREDDNRYEQEHEAVQLGIDLRDNGGERPDDN